MATRVYPQDENRKREFTVKKIVLFLMVFSFSMSVKAIDNGPVFEDPVMQSKYEQLISEIRCLVCQNQSIKDSNVFLAVDLRNEIRRLLENGRSESDIKNLIHKFELGATTAITQYFYNIDGFLYFRDEVAKHSDNLINDVVICT